MSPILTSIDGEDIYYHDLMTGVDTLPERQHDAFRLICLQGYTESAATEIMLPDSKWSTPVQQYSDDGLKKMIAAYDAKQAGTWDPEAVKKKRRSPTRKREDVTTMEAPPEVPEETAEQANSALVQAVRNWDWTTWSDDHTSLANYITSRGVEISPAQVKAVSFLKGPWYNDPAQVQAREDRKVARRHARDKFANETPEQRKARHLADRKIKSAKLAEQKLKGIQDQIKQLRIDAGLNPETGEPVAQQ